MERRPRGRPKGRCGKAAILTPIDLTKILNIARGSKRNSARIEVAVMLSVELGLLAGDLAALTVGDLFDLNGALRLGPENCIADISSASRRLRDALSAYWDRHLAGSHQDSPLFRSQRGRGLSRASLARLLTSLYRDAGITCASSRSGRRTATWRMMAPH